MTTQMLRLQVHPRPVLGKKVKRLRQQGQTPLHLYGAALPSLALQADSKALVRTLVQAGHSRPVMLEVASQEAPHITFVREIQFHPLTSTVVHVDFQRVVVSEPVEVEVPILLEGQAPAVQTLSGSLVQELHTLRIKALPLEVPEVVRVEISSLDSFDKVIRVADVQVPSGVTVLSDPEQLVVYVQAPVAVEAPQPEAAAVPEAGEAPAAEGEAEQKEEEE